MNASSTLPGIAALITSIGGTFGIILPLLRRQGRDLKAVNAAVNHAEPGEPPLRQVTLDVGTSVLLVADNVRRLEGKLDRQGKKLNHQASVLRAHLAKDEEVQRILLEGQSKINALLETTHTFADTKAGVDEHEAD